MTPGRRRWRAGGRRTNSGLTTHARTTRNRRLSTCQRREQRRVDSTPRAFSIARARCKNVANRHATVATSGPAGENGALQLTKNAL